MKLKVLTMLLIVFVAVISQLSYAETNETVMEHKAMLAQHHMNMMNEGRISLGLSPMMKQHQLENMRSHLQAVQTIVQLIAENKFTQASTVAHKQLGLTKQMKRMCNQFKNEDFKKMGLAFHKSGDKLGEVLLTGDVKKSLKALHQTMNYCIQCHARFRQ